MRLAIVVLLAAIICIFIPYLTYTKPGVGTFFNGVHAGWKEWIGKE